MPKKQPEMSWTKLRLFTEKLQWRNERGELVTGFNVPKGVKSFDHVPFMMKSVTQKGERMDGQVTCIKVDQRYHRRLVKFVASNEIRWVYDILILEVDGTIFFAH